MWLKYIIKRGRESIVVKYNIREEKVVLGGYAVFSEFILLLTKPPYFESVDPHNVDSQKNKIRFIGYMSLDLFHEVIRMVGESFYCERVNNVNRLL